MDEKFLKGSDVVAPTKQALEFISNYTSVFNLKSTSDFVALFHPASLKCYKASKHPEYYQMEINGLFVLPIKSLKELRKIRSTFDYDYYRLMKYPVNPTHIVIFEGNTKGFGIHSMELIEETGHFFIAYRCM